MKTSRDRSTLNVWIAIASIAFIFSAACSKQSAQPPLPNNLVPQTTGTTSGSGTGNNQYAGYNQNGGNYTPLDTGEPIGDGTFEFTVASGGAGGGSVNIITFGAGRMAAMDDSVNLYDSAGMNCYTNGGKDCPWLLRFNWAVDCAAKGKAPFVVYAQPPNLYTLAATLWTGNNPQPVYPSFGYQDPDDPSIGTTNDTSLHAVGQPFNYYGGAPAGYDPTSCEFFNSPPGYYGGGADPMHATVNNADSNFNGFPTVTFISPHTGRTHTVLIQLIGFGEPGCYSGSQKLYAPIAGVNDGNLTSFSQTNAVAIQDAYAQQLPQLVTMAAGSTTDSVRPGVTNILKNGHGRLQYRFDLGLGKQNFYEITTYAGLKIQVTEEHRMVLGDGTLAKAKDLQVGDSVMTKDGKDTVTNIAQVPVESKAWNVVMDSSSGTPGDTGGDLLRHIVLAEGFWTGDYYAQIDANNTLTDLKRLLTRINLDGALLQ